MNRLGKACLLFGLFVPAAGCKSKPSEQAAGSAKASASAPAPVASGVPISAEAVSQVVNPAGDTVYSGPAGAVRGVITAKGDPALEQPQILAKIGEECAPAREVYGKLFREGPGRTLADVLVAVTDYKGYIPEQRSIVEVPASGCAWSARTYALTFGQRMDIVAKDRRAYLPDLLGSKMDAQLVALPGGSGSVVYPPGPGRYVLMDSLHLFTAANVIVLKYATHDVTGLDGRFSIERIPAGKVKLGVLLPATGAVVEREIEIEPSRTLELNIELPFDAKQYAEQQQKAPPASSAAKPPASATPKP